MGRTQFAFADIKTNKALLNLSNELADMCPLKSKQSKASKKQMSEKFQVDLVDVFKKYFAKHTTFTWDTFQKFQGFADLVKIFLGKRKNDEVEKEILGKMKPCITKLGKNIKKEDNSTDDEDDDKTEEEDDDKTEEEDDDKTEEEDDDKTEEEDDDKTEEEDDDKTEEEFDGCACCKCPHGTCYCICDGCNCSDGWELI